MESNPIAKAMRLVANRLLAPMGVKIVPEYFDFFTYQHDYGAGGYAAYRGQQVRANKAKLSKVWADDRTLEAIAADLDARGLRTGICHGARNGYEVAWFRDRLGSEVVGTDISDTAAQFANMVVADFHEPRVEWVGAFDFVYTNALDQAFNPERALETWAGQLAPQGRIYIEHTMRHSAAGASAMDPFGAHPMVVPYLLFQWGKGKYSLTDILEPGEVAGKGKVWVFVIEREVAGPVTTVN